MFESMLSTIADERSFTTSYLLLSLGVALLLGIMISMVYMRTNRKRMPSQSFVLTLVILAAIISIIILLVGNSIARAFSLAGAFSIIRFRSAPGNPKDITYVLFSMAIGLCCGMGYIGYAVIVAVVLCIVMIILDMVNFGENKSSQKLLKITIPENLDYQNAFDGVLKKYVEQYKLIKVRTIDLGSLYELQYTVIGKENMDEKNFIDDLRCRNGNLSITLVMDAPQSEF